MSFVRKTASKSIQLDSDAQRIFIGRTGELLFFVQNILKPEEPTHNIISISGQGGVGKSALLKQFINTAHTPEFKDYCLTGIVNERQITATSMMEKFAVQLRQVDSPLTNFEDALIHFKEALRKLQTEHENVRDAVLRKTATDVAGSVAKGIPMMGGILEDVAKATTGFVVDEFQYHSHLKDAERLVDPLGDLTNAFVEDLNRLANARITSGINQVKRQQRVLLFFDTFERLAIEATPWLLDYFLETDINSNIVLVLAGRDPIERSTPNDPKLWLPYLDDNTIYQLYLNSFSEEETRKYLAARNITDTDQISTIWQLSRGLPLYLSILTTNPNGKVDPTVGVVANFLRWIPEQEQTKRRLALDAALFSRAFNQDELVAFKYISENERSSLFSWLTELPFVQSNLQDGRYSYHETIQELFARYLHRRSQIEYISTRKALADYYSKMLEKKEKEGKREIYRSAEWLELSIALAQQLFFLPDETDQIKAIEHILSAYKYQSVGEEKLLIRTLHELSKSQFDNEMSSDALQTVRMLLRYVETVLTKYLTRSWEDLLEAVNYFLEKVAQAVSFPVKLLADLYYTQGEVNRLLRRYQQALSALNRAIELDEENAEPLLARARTYQIMRRYDDALADLDRAIELDPKYTHVGQETKGKIFLSIREHEKAAEACIKAIIAHPTCMAGWELLLNIYRVMYSRNKIPELLRAIPLSLSDDTTGLILTNRAKIISQIGLHEEALIDLDLAIELRPKDGLIFLCRGDIYDKQKLYEKAIADYTIAISLMSDNVMALISRARTYREMGRYDDALADLDSIVEYYSEFEPKNKEDRVVREHGLYLVRTQRGKSYPYRSPDIAHYERGLCYRAMGRYDDALADLDRAIELDEENAEPVIARARTYQSIGRYNDALADLDCAIELDPNYTHVGQKEKGLIFYSQRRYEEAIDALIKAIAAHPPCEGCWTLLARMYGDFYSTDLIPKLLREVSIPKVSEALVNAYRAIALKNTGYYEEALSDITQAIEIRPKTAWIIFQRSQIYKELRRYEEALADMTQAHKLDNSLIKDWWNEQGLMLSYLGRYDEAINSYEQSLKEYPSNNSTLYNIAVAKTRANLQNAQTSISAAFSVFQELVKNNTEQGSAYYGLGGLEALVGHTSEALDYLERAISLEKQAINWAKHDMAWLYLRSLKRFQVLISRTQ